MRRIRFVGAAGALSLALIVPTAAVAGDAQTFWREVTTRKCIAERGQFGFGKVQLGVKAYGRNDVAGMPTPNNILFVVKYQERVDDAWVTRGTGTLTSPTYPDGYAGVFEYHVLNRHQFDTADRLPTRLVIVSEFWDDLESRDVKVGQIKARTLGC
jgi:hypothetical protein